MVENTVRPRMPNPDERGVEAPLGVVEGLASTAALEIVDGMVPSIQSHIVSPSP
jgi:hypothetical protein